MRTQIVEGRFVPGYRLVISQLAKELGTSIGPVREAIRLLEAEGLVQYERNVGAQVALPDASEYYDQMQTLAILEAAALRLAVPHLTQEVIDRARASNRDMRTSLERVDPARTTAMNREFHHALFSACPNKVMLAEVRRGWERIDHLRLSSFGFAPERATESVREHEQLLVLIESGADEWDIERYAREHRLGTLAAVRAHQATARR
ncbi:GntR family transcriptional regulator [Microbacterium sp. ISL-108]|nr:GntR family transcriptional regulator [Microbacterium sp. ISL-108]RKN69696.1 GntR family transcriptional regulator [Microbacterium sp. CGR2]